VTESDADKNTGTITRKQNGGKKGPPDGMTKSAEQQREVVRYSSVRVTWTPALLAGPERSSGSSVSCYALLGRHPSLCRLFPWWEVVQV
jgi:hypothetical protein